MPMMRLYLLALIALVSAPLHAEDDWEVKTPEWKKRYQTQQYEYAYINTLEKWLTAFESRVDADDGLAVKYLLKLNRTKKFGFDINTKLANRGETYLHRTAVRGNGAAAKALIEFGADVNAKNENDQTPLHIAASTHADKVIEALLKQKNIDLFAVDKNSESIMITALANRNCALSQRLQAKGVKLDKDEKISGKPALDWLIESDNLCALRILAPDKKTAESLLGDDQETLLHRAADKDAQNSVKYLMTLGLSAQNKNADGFTPFDLATRKLNWDMATLIAERDQSFFYVPLNDGEMLFHKTMDTGSPANIRDIVSSSSFIPLANKEFQLPSDILNKRIKSLGEKDIGAIAYARKELSKTFDDIEKMKLETKIYEMNQELKGLKKLLPLVKRREKIAMKKSGLKATIALMTPGKAGASFCNGIHSDSRFQDIYGTDKPENAAILCDQGCHHYCTSKTTSKSESEVEIAQAFADGTIDFWLEREGNPKELFCSKGSLTRKSDASPHFSMLTLSLIFGRDDLTKRYLEECTYPNDVENLRWALDLFASEKTRTLIQSRFPLYDLKTPHSLNCEWAFFEVKKISLKTNNYSSFWKRVVERIGHSKPAMNCDSNWPTAVSRSLVSYLVYIANSGPLHAEAMRRLDALAQGPYFKSELNKRTKNGETILSSEWDAGNEEMALHLIELGADLNAKVGGKNNTLSRSVWLDIAQDHAQSGYEPLMKFLKFAVAHGANLNDADENGAGIFHYHEALFKKYSQKPGFDKIISQLKKLGAKLNHVDKNGRLPIDYGTNEDFTAAALRHKIDPLIPVSGKVEASQLEKNWWRASSSVDHYESGMGDFKTEERCQELLATTSIRYLAAQASFNELFDHYQKKALKFLVAWRKKDQSKIKKLLAFNWVCCVPDSNHCAKTLRMKDTPEFAAGQPESHQSYCSIMRPLEQTKAFWPKSNKIKSAENAVIETWTNSKRIEAIDSRDLKNEYSKNSKRQLDNFFKRNKTDETWNRIYFGIMYEHTLDEDDKSTSLDRDEKNNLLSGSFDLAIDIPSRVPVRTQFKRERERLIKKFRLESPAIYWQARHPGCAETLSYSKVSQDSRVKHVSKQQGANSKNESSGSAQKTR